MDSLWQHGLNNLAAVACVMTGEVATNAVQHARTPFRITVLPLPSAVVIEVRDGARAMPLRHEAGTSDVAGRGLMLVDALADEWGVRREDTGKSVWFAVSEAEPSGN